MPYPTELTQDFLGIMHAASGVVTGADLMTACESATQLIQITENFQYEFSDFTDATELRLQPGDLDKIVEMDRVAAKFRPHAIIVIVAPQDVIYRFAQAWKSRIAALNWTIHIARKRDEAVRWLTQHIKTERPELLAEPKKNVA